jgi:hypothetical protein
MKNGLTIPGMKKKPIYYYFALGDILEDRGMKQTEARREFGFDQHGPGYISKTGFQGLCSRPRQVSEKKLNILCNAMNLTPGELWKSRE